ncbi:MAG: HNH endonuclease [Hyphomicrobiaceae bacterium]
MAKAILTTKPGGKYDDLPEERYHFPKSYLNQVESAVGDLIIYYEPRRTGQNDHNSTGRQSYVAIARVTSITQDQSLSDHYYAHIADFLHFDNAVPFRQNDHYYESVLRREDGKTSKGAFGRSVRTIPDDEFELILADGFEAALGDFVPDDRSHYDNSFGFDEEQQPFERPLVETTLTRPFRDRAFSRQVRQAYDCRCALTGLRLINGLGRPEVQAANIIPVADNGPDSIRNGLALSSTVHWMFDRGLVAIDNDYSIVTGNVPPEMGRLINASGRAAIPESQELQPHLQFLRYHREHIFKG